MLIGQISYKVMSHDHDLTRFRVLGILIIFLMLYLHDLGYIYLHDIYWMLKFALYCEIKLQTKQLEFIQYVGVLIH